MIGIVSTSTKPNTLALLGDARDDGSDTSNERIDCELRLRIPPDSALLVVGSEAAEFYRDDGGDAGMEERMAQVEASAREVRDPS